MHYILHIELRGFYVASVSDEMAQRRPVVVFHRKSVRDSNHPKIEPGMTLSDARALAEEAVFIDVDKLSLDGAKAEWLTLAAQFSDRIQSPEPHRAWIDLSPHPEPESIASQFVEELKQKTPYGVRVGNGNCRWLAELASSRNDGVMPIFTPRRYLATLPTECLIGISPDDRRRLIFLGYRFIGEVAEIPAETLIGQFGQDGIEIFRHAQGGGDPTVATEWPKAQRSRRLVLPGGVQDALVLESVLDRLMEAFSHELKQEDLAGRGLEITVKLENGESVWAERTFARSLQDYAGLRIAARTLFPAEIHEPVVEIRVCMRGLEKTVKVQKTLEDLSERSTRVTGQTEAMKRIRAVFGKHSIELGSQRQEPRRQQVLRAWRDATGWA